MENTCRRIIARKNDGSEIPANATTENVLSKIEYCLVAEITPIGIAINSCSINATAATKNEFHTNLPMTSVTGIL